MTSVIERHLAIIVLWSVVILLGMFIIYQEAKVSQKNQKWLEEQLARIENRPLLQDY